MKISLQSKNYKVRERINYDEVSEQIEQKEDSALRELIEKSILEETEISIHD